MPKAVAAIIFVSVVCVAGPFLSAQSDPSNNMFPQWSHDGRRIAFTSDRDGDPEIYVMNADGSAQHG